MRKTLLSQTSFTLLTACLAGALSYPVAGRTVDLGTRPVLMFNDWSRRHVVYPRVADFWNSDPRRPGR
jgi:hypothetical protein